MGSTVTHGISLGVSYFGNRYPDHARADLRAMVEMGATYVVHVMSEADLRWNPGTIAELIELSHEAGLETWLAPWGVAGVFGGEAPSYAVMEHPSACQRDNESNHLPALCPNRPEFGDTVLSWLEAAATTGARVCLWDEPHLAVPRSQRCHGRWACRCNACRWAFKDQFGYQMPASWSDDVATFVQENQTRTLAWLIGMARARGVDSAVVLLPEEDAGTHGWREIAALPSVRFFGVTPYWVFQGVSAQEMPDYVRRWCERVVSAVDGTGAAPLAWVQAFSIPAGREIEIEQGIAFMVESGIRSIAVWSYLACAAMSDLRPDDPAAVWAAVSRAFGGLRDRA
jgi:hypothetical protein